MLDRYSDKLFSTVLAIIGPDRQEPAVAQAALVAQLEGARLFALQVTETSLNEAQREPIRQWFAAALREAGILGEIGFEQGDLQGDLSPLLMRRANLVDLLVLDSMLLADGVVEFDECNRPLLLLSGEAQPIRRILLLYDGRPQAHEALFVAAYMAEMWGCPIVVLAEPAAAPGALKEVAPYLELHESPPESIIAGPLAPDTVFRTAAEHDCDLVIVGGYTKQPLSKSEVASWLQDTPQSAARPLLICP
jgi:nucleotide-binding universal stress UspA family protein